MRFLPTPFLIGVIITAVIVASMAFSNLKKTYIEKGKQEIIQQLKDAETNQQKKEIEELKNAKQIDKRVGAMSDNAIRDSLRDDFRDQNENRQDGSVQTMAKDQTKPQGHGRDAQTGTKKQPETDGLLQKNECYSVEIENNDGSDGKIMVCDDG